MDREEDLEALAAQVRSVYWARCIQFEVAELGQSLRSGPTKIPRWDGGEDARGVRHRPLWPRIAARLLEAGLSAEVAVAALFDGYHGTQAPRPDLLLRLELLKGAPARAAARHEAVLKAIERERQMALAELQRLRSYNLAEKDANRLTITSRRELSPLFRFCLAHQTGETDLAADYVEAAFVQYAQEPAAYDQALGSALPDEFKTRLAGCLTQGR